MRNITDLTAAEIARKVEVTKTVKEVSKILGVTYKRIFSNFYENGTTTIKFYKPSNVAVLNGIVESLEKNRIKAKIRPCQAAKGNFNIIVTL